MRTRYLVAAIAIVSAVVPQIAEAQTLYVSRNAVGVNQIAQFHIEANGTLTPLDPANVNSGLRPSGIATSPNGTSLYASAGSASADVNQYDISASGALGTKTPFTVPAGTGTTDVVVSPDSTDVYFAGTGATVPTSRIFQYDANPQGLLTAKAAPFIAGNAAELAMTNRRVYGTDRTGNSVRAFGYDPLGSGELTASTGSTFNCATSVTLNPAGTSLYAAAAGCSSDVAQYDVNPTTGLLTPKTPATAALPDGSGQSLAATATSLYVANGAGIDQFDINPSTGALTLKPSQLATSAGYTGIAVSPDGTSVYAVRPNNSTIEQYTIGAGGQLAPKSPATVSVTGSPLDIAVTSVGDGSSPPPEPPPVTPDPPAEPDPEPPPKEAKAFLEYEGQTITTYEYVKGVIKIRGTCDLPSSVKGNYIECLGATAIYITQPIKLPGGGWLLPNNFPPFPRAIAGGKKQPEALAEGTFKIPDGTTKTIKLKLTKAGKKALAKKKGKKLKAYQLTGVRSAPGTFATGVSKISLVPK